MVGELIRHEGVLFRRMPKGGYERVVYCPRCRHAMFSMLNKLLFSCPYCCWHAEFGGQQLDAVMARLDAVLAS